MMKVIYYMEMKNMLASLCFCSIGVLFGIIFTFLFINFDSQWKIWLEMLFGTGGSAGGLLYFFKVFNVKNQNQMFLTTLCFVGSMVLSIIISLFVMCILIKDKDDTDILRIRDILLGQKSYIEKYYQSRQQEIDDKLNIKKLQEREKELSENERKINEEKIFLESEEARILDLGKSKLYMELPINRRITITKEFMKIMPSYTKDICNCMNTINNQTLLFLDRYKNDINEANLLDLKAYLSSISTYILNGIFGSGDGVRIHFRYYSYEDNGYQMLVAVSNGSNLITSMTIIPYDSDNMIKQSCKVKRGLIKSINAQHDYQSNNCVTWQDYFTYSFYNLKILNDIPYLSFGISVKNSERYKKTFYFMNYCMFEECLKDNIEMINNSMDLSKIIYGGDVQ